MPSQPPAGSPQGKQRTWWTFAGWQRAAAARTCPGCSRGDSGCRQGAREPARSAELGAAKSTLGNAPARCRGAGVHGECLRRKADNNKEGIWVRVLAGLRWGCGEGRLVQRLWKQPFLGILHLLRVGKGMGSDPGEPRSRTIPLWEPGCLCQGLPRPSLTLASVPVTRGVVTPESFPEDD